jgi:CRP-like cAMP-binding protein
MNVNHLFINLADPVLFQSFGGEEAWTKVTATAGTKIFVEGEHSQDFYYIFSGSVSVEKSLKDEAGSQKHLATLGEGDFFGEGALLSDKTRAATVTALSDTILLKLSQKSFETLVVKDPQAAVGIILGLVKVLNARLQDTNERLVVLHHVAQLVRVHQGDPTAVLTAIFKELEGVLHHGMLVLFGADGVVQLQTESTDASFADTLTQGLPAVVPHLSVSGAAESYYEGNRLYVGVKNLQGQVVATLGAQVCTGCQDEDAHLLLTIAEQIGHLL